MSPSPSSSPTPSLAPHLANSLFLRRLICYLMPYFAPVTKSMDRAEADIIETLTSYGARTRSELLNVVQILAYSMSGLELLTTAKADTSLSPSLQIRLRGCANNLNRSAHQAEKTLTACLKCDLPKTQPEPINDTPQAQTEEILHRIDAQVAAARAAAHPATRQTDKRQKGSAIFNALFNEAASTHLILRNAGQPPQPAAATPPSVPPAPQPPGRSAPG
jgi:hypothetical protein